MVKNRFKKIYDNGYIYEKIEPQAFCEKCNKFLSDRELQISCPKCGQTTKAEQCDNCQYVPTIEDLKDGVCLECKEKVVLKDNKNIQALELLQKQVNEDNNLITKRRF